MTFTKSASVLLRRVWLSVLLLALLWGCGPTASPPTSDPAAPEAWVSSASPEATAAGIDALRAGGNAIDAAIAVSFALGVTEPAMSGLGGQTQIVLFRPDQGGLVINGTSFAPAGTPRDVSAEDLRGHRATSVPTTVRVLDYVHRRYGSGVLSWKELIAPAIRHSEEGFVVGSFRRRVWARHESDLRDGAGTAALFLRPNGSAPEEGETFRQPVLAETLRRLADHGAGDFYRGEIARDIAADMKAHGGWVTLEELENVPEPMELAPLRGSYRGYDVWTLPPPGGGWVVLQILHRLEAVDPTELRPGSSERIVHLARELAFGHRSRSENPVPDLIDYEEAVRERIDKTRLRELAGTRGETTHFSIIDGAGMAVSVTASVNAYYGARAASPSLGFVYNDYMNEFELDDPAHPFAIAPLGLPYSSMSPTIVTREGEVRLVVGSPGSARIVSAVAQVIQSWVDGDADLQRAVTAPRVHAGPSGEIFLEVGAEAPSARLRDEGLLLVEPNAELATEDGNPYFGGVHAVGLGPTGWVGVADPRRDGSATRLNISERR